MDVCIPLNTITFASLCGSRKIKTKLPERKRKIGIHSTFFSTYVFPAKVIIKSLERQQTKELAHEHGTGLHKWMLEWSNLTVGTLRLDVICPSGEEL